MPIFVNCPGCKKKLRVADEHAGKTLKCPACGQKLVVSAAGKMSLPRDSTPAGEESSRTSARVVPPRRYLKLFKIDRLLLRCSAAGAFLLGVLVVTRVLRHKYIDAEVAIGLLVIPILPLVLGTLYHHLIRTGSRWYVVLGFPYFLIIFVCYNLALQLPANFVEFQICEASGDQDGALVESPALMAAIITTLVLVLIYTAVLIRATIYTYRDDVKAGFLPKGGYSFALALFFFIVGLPTALSMWVLMFTLPDREFLMSLVPAIPGSVLLFISLLLFKRAKRLGWLR